jgi:CheY-like chemotaxis protein
VKILAVDDDEFILKILNELVLAISHHQIELASSSRAAAEAIKAADEPFDCFLLDIQMPEITGIELCKMIRDLPQYSNSPILMITAMSDKTHLDQAFAAGANNYITKPFNMAEVGSGIEFAEKMYKRSNQAFGPVAKLCRAFNRIFCAKEERLWERNVQQNLDRKRSGLH